MNYMRLFLRLEPDEYITPVWFLYSKDEIKLNLTITFMKDSRIFLSYCSGNFGYSITYIVKNFRHFRNYISVAKRTKNQLELF
jgi:hypothetical protein